MVSSEFPRKFPAESKSFLNPVYQFALGKQETSRTLTVFLLGINGFLRWRKVSSQETIGFLNGFLKADMKGQQLWASRE